MKKAISIIGLIISISINAQEKNWVTYVGTTYTIDYPVSSELVRIDLPNSDFTLISSDPKDNFTENIMVMISNYGLSEFKERLDLFKIEYAKKITQYKEVKINNKDAYHIILKEERAGIKVIAEQYHWNKNDKSYTLTFIYEDKINNIYKDAGLKILKTFKLL